MSFLFHILFRLANQPAVSLAFDKPVIATEETLF